MSNFLNLFWTGKGIYCISEYISGGPMKIITKRLLIITVFLLAFFITAICLRVGTQEPLHNGTVLGGKLVKNSQAINTELAAESLSRQTIQVMNQRMSNLNEIYFRPSALKALNSNFMEPNSLHNSFPDGKVSSELISTPEKSAVNYFSVLQQASNLTEEKNGGCGTIGYGLEPFPIAYSFLSENNKKSMNYEEFVDSFQGIGHINLIKLLPIKTNKPNTSSFFIELEILEGSSVGVTTFNYYTGELEVLGVNDLYYIDSLTLSPEDFFCAAYHGWSHNAESYVETVYGGWCGLILKQYPPDTDDYIKKIVIDGVDDKKYMFEFARLTNGTDLLINSLVKEGRKWLPVEIDIEKCLDKSRIR